MKNSSLKAFLAIEFVVKFTQECTGLLNFSNIGHVLIGKH